MKAQKAPVKSTRLFGIYNVLVLLSKPSKLPIFKKYGLQKYVSIIFSCIGIFALVTIYYAILSITGATIRADQMRLYFVLTLSLISISVWVGVTPWGKPVLTVWPALSKVKSTQICIMTTLMRSMAKHQKAYTQYSESASYSYGSQFP